MGRSKTLLILLLIFISIGAYAQKNRYMVFFKDKAGSEYAVSSPQAFLSPKALTRRNNQGISVTEDDVPVNTSYITALKDLGADVFFPTRWMNGVLIQCEPSIVPSIQALSHVKHVEFVAPNAKLLNSGRKKTNTRNKAIGASEVTDPQLSMIGLDKMHEAGFKGEGITIAIFDGGFEGVDVTTPFQHLFDQDRIDLNVSHDFVYNSDNVFQYDDHGTQVFSVIAAYQPGTFTGGAYAANYQLYVTEEVPTEYRIEEYNWLFAAERADSAGADIISASLGYYDFDNASMNYTKAAMDGKTTVVSKAAQMAADRGIVVVCSAGNEGNVSWQIISAPADVEDVLAIANVNINGQRANSSSKGPTADGRIKPDVAALGVNTQVVKPNGSLGTATGTSLATPLITCLAAGVWQRFPGLTNKEILSAIRNAGSQALSPDTLIGFGIPNFETIVNHLEQENLFEVYPNPVSFDTIVIKPKDPEEISSCSIEILTEQGQVVVAGDVLFSKTNPTFKANVEPVAEGMYFLKITYGDRKFVYKLIKHHP